MPKKKSKVKTSGNVIVTIYHGDKKVDIRNKHNTGNINLCKYIRDALIGKHVISSRPYFIVPCRLETGSLTSLVPLISYGIPLTGTQLTEDGISAYATLRFLIPSAVLSAGSIINGFRLYGNGERVEPDNLYAEVNYGEEGIEINESNTNLDVKWTLEISYTKESEV